MKLKVQVIYISEARTHTHFYEAHLMMISNISIFCAKAQQKCIVKIALKGFLFSASKFIKFNLKSQRDERQFINCTMPRHSTMAESTSFERREREKKSRSSLLCRQKSMTTCTISFQLHVDAKIKTFLNTSEEIFS